MVRVYTSCMYFMQVHYPILWLRQDMEASLVRSRWSKSSFMALQRDVRYLRHCTRAERNETNWVHLISRVLAVREAVTYHVTTR